ncbi:unnamed protein product [Effrenium voratum]|nr:unnamed protein product [Effrenium voratum]
MGADDLDAETLKRLKREAAIRSKEQDFERRKKAEERKKREQLQALREEYESKQQKREQERLALLKKQTELRARKKDPEQRNAWLEIATNAEVEEERWGAFAVKSMIEAMSADDLLQVAEQEWGTCQVETVLAILALLRA